MRKPIKEFVQACSETLSFKEPIYEFGALQVPGQEEFADLRRFFSGKKYIGSDIRSGPGVDITLNLHKLILDSNSIGSILCLETLEHVEKPWLAMKEMYRVLKQDGILVISSQMNFPIHDFPGDYWRYTPEAFKSLLSQFTNSWVSYAGEDNFPHAVVGIGFKGKTPPLRTFKRQMNLWQKKWYKPVKSSQLAEAIQPFVPPITFDFYRLILRGLGIKETNYRR